jgi:hypothetical protein
LFPLQGEDSPIGKYRNDSLVLRLTQRSRSLHITPHSRIGTMPLGPREAFSKVAESMDNPAPAKSDDPRYALKPVRVREFDITLSEIGERGNLCGNGFHSLFFT